MEVYTCDDKDYSCTECGKYVGVILVFDGVNHQWDELHTFDWICKECLEKALTLINKEIENE